MLVHSHTRSDHCRTYSPRIPSIGAPIRTLKCDECTERRVRRLLTWHAGSCGLISDKACDAIVAMLLGGELTTDDLRSLATPGVYATVCERFYEIQRARESRAHGA
jgi:hypothetical protein